jgi:hypothetical protein
VQTVNWESILNPTGELILTWDKMEVFDLGHPLLDMEDDERGGNKAHGEDDADGMQQAVIRKYNYSN